MKLLRPGTTNGRAAAFAAPGAYGLTKRELLAAMVLGSVVTKSGSGTYADMAREAVCFADALLAALEDDSAGGK